MEAVVKQEIVSAAAGYMEQHKLSLNDMALRSNINISYLSVMMNGETHAGKTLIKDSWFALLASAVDYSLKRKVWPFVWTKQSKQIAAALEATKKDNIVLPMQMIIGDSGSGKSLIVQKFCNKYPKYTYRVTANSVMNLSDLVGSLMGEMGIPCKGSKHNKLIDMVLHLRRVKMMGEKPVIIIDECENLHRSAVRMLKSLFDGVSEHCTIVLIGTDQLESKLIMDSKKNVEGMPQFYSRIQGGIRRVDAVNRNFTPFFDALNIEKGLRKLLVNICNDYRILNQYLEPALVQAEEEGEALTEALFRKYMNMPG